jgi:V8-like Glu-specific endopeptidase
MPIETGSLPPTDDIRFRDIIPGATYEDYLRKQGRPPASHDTRQILDIKDGAGKPAAPYRAICYLELNFPSGTAAGTGTFIDRRIVLTAAHNLYRRGEDEEVRSVVVVPGQYRSLPEPFGRATSNNFDYHPKWRNEDDVRRASQYDFGVIFLDDDRLAQQVNWTFPCYCLTDEGWNKLKSDYWLNVSGFPVKFDHFMLWGTGKPNKLLGNVIQHDIPTTNGQSGAPMYYDSGRGFYLLGVHTDGVGLTDMNGGVRITHEVKGWIENWLGSPGVRQGGAFV